MEFNEVIENRYSVRKFSNEAVSQKQIEEILEVGRIAPSAGNHQSTFVYVLDEDKIEKLKSVPTAKIHPVVFRAKQALLVCYNKNIEMKRPHDEFSFGITDSSIVTTYMMLKITELGLGSVWVGWFSPKLVKSILEIPEEYEVSAILPFGHIQKGNRPSGNHNKRKPIDDFRIDLLSL